ncbi:MAG TPA: hypothetical protein VIQ81_02330 [Gammaproteobacteria bacterium]
MTMKLVQKRFLNGSREFEIVDDAIFVRIKSLFKEEKLTVDLSILDPEPVINDAEMTFYSPHKGQPVFSLLLNRPNAEEFNNFIDALKRQIKGEYNSEDINVVSPEKAQSALAWNVHEEPPEFDEPGEAGELFSFKPVNAARVATDISMLKAYLNEDDIKPLLDALEVIQAEPDSETAFKQVLDAFDQLGIIQGAVLTYAPYLKVVLSEARSI